MHHRLCSSMPRFAAVLVAAGALAFSGCSSAAGGTGATAPPASTVASAVAFTVVDATPIDRARLDALLATGTVATADFSTGTSRVIVRTDDGSRYVTRFPESYTAELMTRMLDAGAQVGLLEEPAPNPSPGGFDATALFEGLTIVAILAGVAGAVWFSRRRRQHAIATRGPKAIAEADIPRTRFTDVAGCEEAVADLAEIVDFLARPERFTRLGAKAPSGALLYGPPGTGKTLLAKAVAGESGVKFFAANGAEFVELYVGVGPKRVRELFAKARANAPAIVFIDEIDAVARARSTSAVASGQEHDNTLIALLAELDGFHDSNVVMIGATNRMDSLDPALLRPGRMDRKISVGNPDRRGRTAILGVHTRNKPLDHTVDLGLIAARTPNMSGAELEAIANEAALEAVRRDLDALDASCFDAAIATVAMGRARTSALVTTADRQITIWHEAGHAVLALTQEEASDPVSVSVIPRGSAGGVTWMAGTDEQFLSRTRARAMLAVALGGRAAEELLLDGEFTQGAYGDLTNATQLAADMVRRFGMTRRGLAVRDGDDKDSDAIVDELLAEALDVARAALVSHRAMFDALVAALDEHDTLVHEQLSALARTHLGRAVRFAGSDDPTPAKLPKPAAHPGARTHLEPSAPVHRERSRHRRSFARMLLWRRDQLGTGS